MRILLVNPNLIRPAIPPLGLEYAAEFLAGLGHVISIIDFIENQDIASVIVKEEPDVIGIHIRNIDNADMLNSTGYLLSAKKLIASIKKIYSKPIFIGGPAINLEPEEILNFVKADYAVATNGVSEIGQMINGIDKGSSKRVYVNFSDAIEGNFKRGMIDYKPYIEQKARIGVNTKTGCVHDCIYCDYPQLGNGKITMRDPSSVVKEVESLHSKGVRHIFFADSNFNIPVEHATEVLKGINELELEGFTWEAFINPHPDYLSDDFLKEAKKSGTKRLYLGFDSLDDETLSYLNKGFSLEDIEKTVNRLTINNIAIGTSLLFGFPGETVESVSRTFEMIDKFKFDYVDINIGVRIYRHTPLFNLLQENGEIDKSMNSLEPFFVPISSNLIEFINKQKGNRKSCNQQGISQYMAPHDEDEELIICATNILSKKRRVEPENV